MAVPSPLGHALGGLSAGWLVLRIGNFGRGGARWLDNGVAPGMTTWPGAEESSTSPSLVERVRAGWREALLFAALAVVPDLDLLVGNHSTYTHSLGAVLLVGLTAWRGTRRGPRMAMAMVAAYGSHILLDWLGTDTSAPIGIMALWPMTNAYYQSDLHWFMAISRHHRLPGFLSHNLRAVLWELFWLAPIGGFAAVLRFRRRRRASA